MCCFFIFGVHACVIMSDFCLSDCGGCLNPSLSSQAACLKREPSGAIAYHCCSGYQLQGNTCSKTGTGKCNNSMVILCINKGSMAIGTYVEHICSDLWTVISKVYATKLMRVSSVLTKCRCYSG